MPDVQVPDPDEAVFPIPPSVERPLEVDEGGRLMDEIVERSGREDLAAWIDAQGIRAKMARAGLRVRIGYSVVLVVLLAGLAFYVR